MSVIEMIFIVLFAGILWHLRKSAKNSNTREARLVRIKNASTYLQAFIVAFFAIGIYWLLAFCFGWHFFGQAHVRIAVSPTHIYASPGEMPGAIFAWWSIKMGVAIFCYGVMFLLFRLYQKGILFSVKNIRCIYCLAYGLIASWFIDYQMQSSLRDMSLSDTPIFVALLIIFVAWVMDEARKIQEEQELTV